MKAREQPSCSVHFFPTPSTFAIFFFYSNRKKHQFQRHEFTFSHPRGFIIFFCVLLNISVSYFQIAFSCPLFFLNQTICFMARKSFRYYSSLDKYLQILSVILIERIPCVYFCFLYVFWGSYLKMS